MYAEYRNLGPRIKNMKNQTKFFALPKKIVDIIIAESRISHFWTNALPRMGQILRISENATNFEELYLRAQ